MIDKIAYEDAREFQIALEYARVARAESEGVLAMQAELEEAVVNLGHHRKGIFARWARRWL